MRRWTRFWALSLAAKGVVLRSLILLPIVALGLRLQGTRRTASALRCASSKVARKSALLTPEETARLVDSASNFLHLTCMPRSMVLCHLLRRDGIPAEMRLGVSKPEGGVFLAHAWVELEGLPLAESAAVRERYAVFPQSETAIRLGPS